MKRKKEVDIVLSCLVKHGFLPSPALEKAVATGLKQIRISKFDERHKRRVSTKRKGGEQGGRTERKDRSARN